MPASFRILKSQGLVYVRYVGMITMDESAAVFSDYMRHPDCRPGQKQFIDLSGVTCVERDYAKFMALQAKKADLLVGKGPQPIIMYYTPTEAGRAMASLILKTWESFHEVVTLVIEDEHEALDIIGAREPSIAELLKTAA